VSRTAKGGKGPGFEYWTARPGNRGKHTKKRTHKAERQIGRRDARETQ
jgi:hypothetical protein